MSTPKVSVIIPVYNVQDYLRECLDSVVNQTVREIEIICVNDGSTDNSGAILEEYAARDCRFVVVHQENAGQSVARNRGLDLARGEFISFLDSDDFWERNMLEKTLQVMENPEIDIVMFFFQTFGENPWEPERGVLAHHKPIYSEMWEKINAIISMYYVVWNQLYRRDFLMKYGIRFLEGCLYEDNHFSIKSVYYCRNIAILPERLYHYRIGSGCTTGPKQQESILRLPEMYRRLLEDFRQCSIRDDVTEYFESLYYHHLRRFYLRSLTHEERPKYRKLHFSQITSFDLEQIRKKNRFLPAKVRFFFLWYARKPIEAYWQFVRALWRKPLKINKLLRLEEMRK